MSNGAYDSYMWTIGGKRIHAKCVKECSKVTLIFKRDNIPSIDVVTLPFPLIKTFIKWTKIGTHYWGEYETTA